MRPATSADLASKAYSYRDDPNVPSFPDDRPLFVFDGKCVLCSGFVQFIMRHDRRGQFRFAAAQSPLGTALYAHYGLATRDYETNLLIENGLAHTNSESSLRVFERLGLPWSLMAVGRLLPVWLLDRLYAIVARNRLRWFGSRDACYLPTPSEAERFLN
ncbi:Predicted thiol-disulfide oxidoreductase YuxK, DCC family [Enhydrobacter aerosaccus]|uniref:Predicted thiol-disulfide oxidoreductase YuxK, DCC family n=1 Tax=Enhydrobacter aerosaccus TaxID=225324 RepID=A0A1T4L733_9HYPH|nr:DCC1-like thiol-disulfide oxidoreductase family protein [Enhydrobacter aerosaccus]SJZ50522.1 Predicted thiol-disulfide oxidoreductase YuxK, DCC family [Enhydrobacter aerosaccus]